MEGIHYATGLAPAEDTGAPHSTFAPRQNSAMMATFVILRFMPFSSGIDFDTGAHAARSRSRPRRRKRQIVFKPSNRAALLW